MSIFFPDFNKTYIQNKWQIVEKKRKTWHNYEDCLRSFLNRTGLICLTWSFSFVVSKATYIASKFFRLTVANMSSHKQTGKNLEAIYIALKR